MPRASILILIFMLDIQPALAQEILFTGVFHGDEVSSKSAGAWIGLFEKEDGYFLKKVKIIIERVEDPIVDNSGEMTGKQVSMEGGGEPALLLRGLSFLQPGLVRTSNPHQLRFEQPEPREILLGNKLYDFSFHCNSSQNEPMECDFILKSGNHSQVLKRYILYRSEGNLIFAGDTIPEILWAGDLDRDGKLDLVLNMSDHYNVFLPTLFLSSAAKGEEIVAAVASFQSVGC